MPALNQAWPPPKPANVRVIEFMAPIAVPAELGPLLTGLPDHELYAYAARGQLVIYEHNGKHIIDYKSMQQLLKQLERWRPLATSGTTRRRRIKKKNPAPVAHPRADDDDPNEEGRVE